MEEKTPEVPTGQSSSVADVEYPKEFICPITQEVMSDPVVCSDGFSYERLNFSSWFTY